MFEKIYSTEVTQRNVKKEVKHLFLLGVVEIANDSEWASPSFA